MFNYSQLDDQSKVVGLQSSPSVIDSPLYREVAEGENPKLGDTWNGAIYVTPSVVVNKNTYSAAEFVDVLTDSEFSTLVSLAKSNDSANAVVERIKIRGINFGDPRDMTNGNRMVSAGVLTQARLDEIVG